VSDQSFPYARPRKVSGGVSARSARGPIGDSWWSRRFLDVLESFALGSRLTRGRNYARTGQVLSIEVRPGTVAAKVQGSRPTPYRVSIGFPPFSAAVWAQVEVALAERAIYSAQLLAGELPPGLEEVFGQAGAPLFPTALADLTLRCSCPDSAVPCKHLAATFYLLAEAFDADPFQILHWRGRDREALLSRLRILRAGVDDRPSTVATAATAGLGTAAAWETAGQADAPADKIDPAEHADRFWFAPVPLPARAATLDARPDLLLRQLPAPDRRLGGPALLMALDQAYQRFGAGPG
jgi:uncharacterized Zn finger protein